MIADYNKIDEALKPNVPAPFFDRGAKIDHSNNETE